MGTRRRRAAGGRPRVGETQCFLSNTGYGNYDAAARSKRSARQTCGWVGGGEGSPACATCFRSEETLLPRVPPGTLGSNCESCKDDDETPDEGQTHTLCSITRGKYEEGPPFRKQGRVKHFQKVL